MASSKNTSALILILNLKVTSHILIYEIIKSNPCMLLHLLHFSWFYSKVLKYLLCISMIRHLEIVACFLKTRQCRPNPILKAYIIGNQNIFFIHISICLRQKQIPISLESNIHHFTKHFKHEKCWENCLVLSVLCS